MRLSRSFVRLLASRLSAGPLALNPHACRLDDPLTWGILPAHTYLNSHLTRWSLGASDIIFTNPYGGPPTLYRRALTLLCSVFSAFFRKGQVLETFRGAGIYQPAIDTAIEKLRAGAWVRLASHIIPPPLFLYIFRIHRYMSSRRAKCASLTPTRRTHKRDSRACGASSGACTSLLTIILFFRNALN